MNGVRRLHRSAASVGDGLPQSRISPSRVLDSGADHPLHGTTFPGLGRTVLTGWSYNEKSVAGEFVRTPARSGSEFTKGCLGVQPDSKTTSATEPANQNHDNRNARHRLRNHLSTYTAHKALQTILKEALASAGHGAQKKLRKPFDNKRSFRDPVPWLNTLGAVSWPEILDHAC